jgi:hypothetical protein
MEKAGLIPEPVLLKDPMPRIWGEIWERNVVNMNEYPGTQRRDYLKINPINITIELRHMTRIDEEDIAFIEPLEQA